MPHTSLNVCLSLLEDFVLARVPEAQGRREVSGAFEKLRDAKWQVPVRKTWDTVQDTTPREHSDDQLEALVRDLHNCVKRPITDYNVIKDGTGAYFYVRALTHRMVNLPPRCAGRWILGWCIVQRLSGDEPFWENVFNDGDFEIYGPVPFPYDIPRHIRGVHSLEEETGGTLLSSRESTTWKRRLG